MAVDYFKKAEELYSKDQIAEAIKYYELSLEQKCYEAAFELGQIYMDLDDIYDINKAINYFLIGAKHNHKKCINELAQIYLNKKDYQNYFKLVFEFKGNDNNYKHLSDLKIIEIFKKHYEEKILIENYEYIINFINKYSLFASDRVKDYFMGVLIDTYKNAYRNKIDSCDTIFELDKVLKEIESNNCLKYNDWFYMRLQKKAREIYIDIINTKSYPDINKYRNDLSSLTSHNFLVVLFDGVLKDYITKLRYYFENQIDNVCTIGKLNNIAIQIKKEKFKEELNELIKKIERKTSLIYQRTMMDKIDKTETLEDIDKLFAETSTSKYGVIGGKMVDLIKIRKVQILLNSFSSIDMYSRILTNINEITSTEEKDKYALELDYLMFKAYLFGENDACKSIDNAKKYFVNISSFIELVYKLAEGGHLKEDEKYVSSILLKFGLEVEGFYEAKAGDLNELENSSFECISKSSQIDYSYNRIYYLTQYIPSRYLDGKPYNKDYINNHQSFICLKNNNWNPNYHINFALMLLDFLNLLNDEWIICTVPGHVKNDTSINDNGNGVSTVLNWINLTNTRFVRYDNLIQRIKTVEKKALTNHNISIDDECDSLNLNPIYNVRYKNVLILDDITTTGTSLMACKKILLKSGAKKVLSLAFGKTV